MDTQNCTRWLNWLQHRDVMEGRLEGTLPLVGVGRGNWIAFHRSANIPDHLIRAGHTYTKHEN